MRIPFGFPLIDEEEKAAVREVLDNPILVHGPKTNEFEKVFAEYTDAPSAVSVSSCTAGMHLAYHSIGLEAGDEVIVPAQTHVATAHAVELTGAKAIFVDVEIETGNIKIDAIEDKITSKTKAIAVVHYLGVPVNMSAVCSIARKYNLFLLEDCALAVGAKFDDLHVGLHGDIGVFSFYPVKHITTAEGGMIITKDESYADKLRILKAFGVDKNHGERKIAGIYDSIELGFNYRMSEIHAAIGVSQLRKLPKFLEQRKKNYEHLTKDLELLPNAAVLPQPSDDRYISSYYCLGLMLNDSLSVNREIIMEELRKQEIGTSIYYPQPVPRMTYYSEKYGYCKDQFQNSSAISDHMIALPIGPHLDVNDMTFIASKIKKIWEQFDA